MVVGTSFIYTLLKDRLSIISSFSGHINSKNIKIGIIFSLYISNCFTIRDIILLVSIRRIP